MDTLSKHSLARVWRVLLFAVLGAVLPLAVLVVVVGSSADSNSDRSAPGQPFLVKDINHARTSSSFPMQLTVVGNDVYFSTNAGRSLWRSDGTPEGTLLIKEFDCDNEADDESYCVADFTDVNGTLFFTSDARNFHRELWKSDGTSEGTVRLKDFVGVQYLHTPDYLTNIDGVLFLVAGDGVHGHELWKSDGTPEGTLLVKDINPGPGWSETDGRSSNLVNVSGTLFLVANDGVHGRELWKSDGTSDGTVLVKDIFTGTASSDPGLVNANGNLFFSAGDGVHGVELWKSDGADENTLLVKDISLLDSSYPGQFTHFNGAVYFGVGAMEERRHARRHLTGCRHLSGLARLSRPKFHGSGRPALFFAEDRTHGSELWAMSMIGVGPGRQIYLPIVRRFH